MRDTSPTGSAKPTLAALVALGLLTACAPDKPANTSTSAGSSEAASAKPAPNEEALQFDRWRRGGDAGALAALWRNQVEANTPEKWEPLLQATAFGLARLRGGKTPPELRDALTAFASSEGIAQHRRLDPRLVLPIAELLWDQRDAAAVLRLANAFGKPPHEQGYRFLKAAADEVASKQPATVTVTGSCAATLDGKQVTFGTPMTIAPGSHTVGCGGAAQRSMRIGPGEAASITL